MLESCLKMTVFKCRNETRTMGEEFSPYQNVSMVPQLRNKPQHDIELPGLQQPTVGDLMGTHNFNISNAFSSTYQYDSLFNTTDRVLVTATETPKQVHAKLDTAIEVPT